MTRCMGRRRKEDKDKEWQAGEDSTTASFSEKTGFFLKITNKIQNILVVEDIFKMLTFEKAKTSFA